VGQGIGRHVVLGHAAGAGVHLAGVGGEQRVVAAQAHPGRRCAERQPLEVAVLQPCGRTVRVERLLSAGLCGLLTAVSKG
jgi:hypothetical protein